MIRKVLMRAALVALLAGAATVGLAAPNTAKRVQAFTKLPNWSGYWIVDSIHETAGSLLDVPKVKFFGDIPYNPKWMAEYNKRRGDSMVVGKSMTHALTSFSRSSPRRLLYSAIHLGL